MKTPLAMDTPMIEPLLQGKQEAWDRFLKAYGPLIADIVAWPKWHFDFHTREDVAQTIRLAITQSICRLKSEQALSAFVRRICFNQCIDRLRKQLREQGRLCPLGHIDEEGEWEETDVADDRFDPVKELVVAERAEALRAALASLDTDSRRLIRDFYERGLSYREIADVWQLRSTPSAAGSRARSTACATGSSVCPIRHNPDAGARALFREDSAGSCDYTHRGRSIPAPPLERRSVNTNPDMTRRLRFGRSCTANSIPPPKANCGRRLTPNPSCNNVLKPVAAQIVC
jgi:RNA polymerase sigma factor (sigma-70 family)